jgi:hypothetical protein
LGRNFGPRKVLGYSVNVTLRSQFLTLRSQLAAITLAAIAAAWFWAIAPMTTSLLYIHPSGWTDADLVRHLWHFRLVQPEWVSSPPQYDYLRWTQAETLARLGVVFLGWLGSAAWLIRRHLRGRAITSPNEAAPPNRRPRSTFPTWLKFDRLSRAHRPLAAAVGEARRSAA